MSLTQGGTDGPPAQRHHQTASWPAVHQDVRRREIVCTPPYSFGFESEDDWFEFRLEHDPRFLERVESTRKSLRAGRGVKLEDVK